MNFTKAHLLTAVKIIVFVAMCYLVANRIFLQNNFNSQLALFKQNLSANKILLLISAVLLMPVNWLLETIKWKALLQNGNAKFSLLLKGVIAGVTFGLVTPARSGEFVGRVIYLDDEDRAKVFYLSAIGGMAQSIVTIVIGALCFALINNDSMLLGMFTGVGAVFLLLYFRFDLLNRLLHNVPFLAARGLVIQHHQLPGLQLQLTVLLISLIRYAVYWLQYVLVFMFFGVSGNTLQVLLHSAVLLLVQTFSPLMPLFDISFRGGSALWVFAPLTDNNLAVLSAVLLIWILNLLLPALAGYLFLARKKPLLKAQL